MRALRPSLVGMVIVCLLGGLSAAAWAQDPSPALPTPVTGTVTGSWGFAGQAGHTEGLEDGVLTGRGYVEHQEVAWSDPRLPPDHWVRMDYAIHGSDRPDLVVTVTSSHLLLGDEGSWRGTGRALVWGTNDRYATYELISSGRLPAPAHSDPSPVERIRLPIIHTW